MSSSTPGPFASSVRNAAHHAALEDGGNLLMEGTSAIALAYRECAAEVSVEDGHAILMAGSSPLARAYQACVLEDSQQMLLTARSDIAQAYQSVVAEDAADDAKESSLSVTDSPASIKPNATACWLDENMARVWPALTSMIATKMVKSKELDVVDDHVQAFLTRLIERDTLAPFLARGETPKMSVLRIWAYQSACTELRRWGVDASLRTTRTARTAREVQKGADFRPVQAAQTAKRVIREDDGAVDMYQDTDETPEDISARRSRVDHVRATLVRMGHANMIPMVDELLGGASLTDLTTRYGVSADQLRVAIRAVS